MAQAAAWEGRRVEHIRSLSEGGVTTSQRCGTRPGWQTATCTFAVMWALIRVFRGPPGLEGLQRPAVLSRVLEREVHTDRVSAPVVTAWSSAEPGAGFGARDPRQRQGVVPLPSRATSPDQPFDTSFTPGSVLHRESPILPSLRSVQEWELARTPRAAGSAPCQPPR